MKRLVSRVFCAVSLLLCGHLFAATVTVPLYEVAPKGEKGNPVGSVVMSDTPDGLLILPNLVGMLPGNYGMHVHTNPSCDDMGLGAGAHFDPEKNNQHLGPYSDRGHLGDLPVLVIDKTSRKPLPTLAPHLTVAHILNRSLVIHAGGDNYFDMPLKNGGGGKRVLCGIIQ